MLELRHLKKTYHLGDNDVHALDDVSLTIRDGEFLAIMGPSGSGKSTLMNVIGLLDHADTGEYILNGKEIKSYDEDKLAELRRDTIGFIFQQFNLLPRLNAKENVELPLVYSGRLKERTNAIKLLNLVGMGERTTHRPTELSGGQQQRVAIARALINTPTLILADEPTGNLDSASEREIINLLKDLNTQGITVVIVTHNEEIGKEARRIIRMRDGKIISDEEFGQLPQIEKHSASPAKSHHPSFLAELSEHFRQGIRSIRANKIRAFLSMLGILIGVAAVVAMLAIGRGAQKSIEKQISKMGSNLLMVRSGAFKSGGVALESGLVTQLTMDDVNAIKKQISGVKNAAPSVRQNAQVVYLNNNRNSSITGTSVDYEEIKAATPTIGRFFNQQEVDQRDTVALLGVTVVRELFGTKNPVGATIKINRINFRVIGVLPEKGSSGPMDQDDIVIIPYTTAMRRLFGKNYIDLIDVEMSTAADMFSIEESIRQLLIKRHKVPPSQIEDAFLIRNMAEIQDMMTSTGSTMSMLIASIAGISLLVGGIGIMNIMLVSVTERTREIGIRKSIGARRRDILMQFLIESFLISTCGGIIGVACGWGASLALSYYKNWATYVTPESVFMALGFSFAVGIFFGVYPALKAARLKPIDALRYE
ncbi:MAG: ABC transporter permease [Bdellovibrionota bacterium]|jgi:macrolide transport system ATP-binding/permease protein